MPAQTELNHFRQPRSMHAGAWNGHSVFGWGDYPLLSYFGSDSIGNQEDGAIGRKFPLVDHMGTLQSSFDSMAQLFLIKNGHFNQRSPCAPIAGDLFQKGDIHCRQTPKDQLKQLYFGTGKTWARAMGQNPGT